MDQNPPPFNTDSSFFNHQPYDPNPMATINECSLPVIDLHQLKSNDKQSRNNCKLEIVKAAKEWGFFQVINHKLPNSLVEKMRLSMLDVFKLPLEKKQTKFLEYGSNCYRPNMATGSEAYHIPLSLTAAAHENIAIKPTIDEYVTLMFNLAHELSTILAEGLGCCGDYVKECCKYNTCYLRLNHYPSCPVKHDEVFGLIPHTDTDFLTIVLQDEVGGLQLRKDEKWIAVAPNPDALVINIGDFFQAWSNVVYKSVEHRVMSNLEQERFSIAYFLCPSDDTVIQSHEEQSIYRKFTFNEFREQNKEDVKLTGYKIGLPRFLETLQ